MRWYVLVALAVLTLLLFSHCGGDDSSSTADFPIDLAIASPTATASARDRREINALRVQSSSTYAEKAAAVQSLATASSTSSCTFNVQLTLATGNSSCYGPNIKYRNHPNGTDTTPVGPSGFSELPGGDVGFYTESIGDRSEPCLASQLNTRISNVAGQVDTALFTMAALRCVMRANDISIPGAGSSVDLTTQVASAFSSNSIDLTVSAAALAVSTDSSGNTVNTWTVTATQSSRTQTTMTARMKHVVTGADSYQGKLSYKVSVNDTSKPGNCNSGSETGYTEAASIKYEKASATSLTYQFHAGQYCGNTADPYVSSTNFTVDASKKFSSSATGWANNFNYGLFTFNPSDGTGSFQFAWQAGVIDNNTRVMNASLSSSRGRATISGCGYFGFGPKIDTSSVGTIERMICNWVGPGGAISSGDYTGQQLAQRQCISRSSTATSSVFSLSSSNITYAPTNDCNSSGTSPQFEFGSTSSTGFDYTSDVTHNLVSVSDVGSNVTAPTPPPDVDS